MIEALGNLEDSHPSRNDVFEVRDILLHLAPAELVEYIMNEAEYWAKLVTLRKAEVIVKASDNPNNSADECYLLSAPIPKTMRDGEVIPTKVKMVKFTTRSCDQGGGGSALARGMLLGTYNPSWTWFEAGIIRPVLSDTTYVRGEIMLPPGIPKRWEVQRNVHASRSRRLHEVIWTPGTLHKENPPTVDGKGAGAGFIESLRPGDCICIMARALYPGWENHVASASIEILYQI
ncbi:hypothetical protein BDQ17DRAFT_1254220 [Cyathus striatus]|nr:hypothetical protein BDQ17DRAFT_1254220 [Cyathus striatus]